MARRLTLSERCQCGSCRKCRKREYDQRRYVEKRDEALKRTKRWYEENRAAKAQYDAEYRELTREHRLETKRRRYALKRDEILARQREYRASPDRRAKAIERTRAWNEANPERRRILATRQNHRRRGAPHEHALDTFYAQLVARDPCSYCGGTSETVDHIEPISLGGTSGWTNLTGACRRCNTTKHSRPLLRFLAEGNSWLD